MAVKRSEIRQRFSKEPLPVAPIDQAVAPVIQAPIIQPVAPTVEKFSSDPSPFSKAARAASIRPSAEQIAVAAYYRALARGFEPGHEVEDWLGAEAELLSGDKASR